MRAGRETEAARGVIHRERHARKAGLDGLKRDGEKTHNIGIDQRSHRAGEKQAGLDAELLLHPGGDGIVEFSQRQKNSDGNHRAGEGIAEYGEPVGAVDQRIFDRPRGVSEQQSYNYRGHRGDSGQSEGVHHQPVDPRAKARFRVGNGELYQHGGGHEKTKGDRDRAHDPCGRGGAPCSGCGGMGVRLAA